MPAELLSCWVCLVAGDPTSAMTIYDGKAYCAVHFDERRRAVNRAITREQ